MAVSFQRAVLPLCKSVTLSIVATFAQPFLGETVDARRLIGAALITAGITGIIAASAR